MLWGKRPKRARTVVLPERGKALVVSDLHGHWWDWQAFLASSRCEERLEAGEELYLIMTGDVPDVARHRSLDPSVPPDGDVQVLEDVMRLSQRYPGRVLYLEGNHDFHLCRIAREVAEFHALRRGRRAPDKSQPPSFTQAEADEYFSSYRESYGERVFENNVAPYDMVARVKPDHVSFLEGCPIVAVLPGAGVVVTHAGPPRMQPWPLGEQLLTAIDAADRDELRDAAPEDYYEAPYHQLLNNRFRNADYTLTDVRGFLAAYGSELLVTGHTPHPYLVDFDKGQPFQDCAFRDGVGLIGQQQAVLCSSFGAFHPALKRYLELELGRRYAGNQGLFDSATAVQPIFAAGTPPPEAPPLPGFELAMGAAPKA